MHYPQGSRRLETVYTTLSEYRASRFFRDMTPPYAIWFFGWLIPAFVALTANSLVMMVLFIFFGWIGANRFRFGPGLTYPVSWIKGMNIWLKKNRVYTGKKQAINLEPTDFMGVIGTLYAPATNDDTVYLRIDGWRNINDDVFARKAANDRVLAVYRNVISQLSGDIRLSQLVRSRPADLREYGEDISENILRNQVATATTGNDAVIRNLLEKKFQQEAKKREKFDGVYALTVGRPSSWRKIARDPASFTVSNLQRSPLMYVLETMRDGLTQQGFVGVNQFTFDDVCSFVYRSWNLGPKNYTPGTNPWPDSIVVDNRNCLLITDGYCHRVLVVTRYARPRVLSNGFVDLQCHNARWVGMTTCASTKAKGAEKFLLKQGRDTVEAFSRQYYKGGKIEDRESRDRRQAIADRVDNLYLSGSKPIRQNRYFLISGNSVEEVDEAERQLMIKLRRREIKAVRVHGRARLLQMFLTVAMAQEW